MKKSILMTSVVLGLAAPFVRSEPAPAPVKAAQNDPVQAELEALQALTRQRPPEGTQGADHYRWFDGLTRRIGEAAFAFIEKHPNDPRRWRAALILQQRNFHPRFMVSIGDDYDKIGEQAVVHDEVARAAWDRRVDALEAELRAAKDVPRDVMQQVEWGDLWFRKVMPVYRAAFDHNAVPDWKAIDGAYDAFLTRWPDFDMTGLLSIYVKLKNQAGEKDEAQVLQRFADSPNRSVREYVVARERFRRLASTPMQMSFTALDGREVDLAKMRGKVVLVDFWATWCVPCIAEIPNVRAVYEKYHDQGFEVVGVSVDNEKDRRKFADLVAEKQVTWPQHFDGQGWKNKYAVEFTVTGVPAMLLLDKNGLLVSTDARGGKLEPEVKRLLAM